MRLLAFFPSRATGTNGKEDDDVVCFSLSLSITPSLSSSVSPPVSHDGSLRLPDPLRVSTRRGFPNGISPRFTHELPFASSSFLLLQCTRRTTRSCFNICTRMRTRGHQLLRVCIKYSPVRIEPASRLSTVTGNRRLPYTTCQQLVQCVPEKGVAVLRRASNLHAISFLAPDA